MNMIGYRVQCGSSTSFPWLSRGDSFNPRQSVVLESLWEDGFVSFGITTMKESHSHRFVLGCVLTDVRKKPDGCVGFEGLIECGSNVSFAMRSRRDSMWFGFTCCSECCKSLRNEKGCVIRYDGLYVGVFVGYGLKMCISFAVFILHWCLETRHGLYLECHFKAFPSNIRYWECLDAWKRIGESICVRCSTT